jgi:hypothetical protein
MVSTGISGSTTDSRIETICSYVTGCLMFLVCGLWLFFVCGFLFLVHRVDNAAKTITGFQAERFELRHLISNRALVSFCFTLSFKHFPLRTSYFVLETYHSLFGYTRCKYCISASI